MTAAQPPARPGPVSASLRRRSLASVLLVGLGLTGMVRVAALTVLLRRLARARLLARGDPAPSTEAVGAEAMALLNRWRVGAAARRRVDRLMHRDRRRVLERLWGLRTVDARHGGPVSLSSALRLEAVDVASGWILGRVNAPLAARRETRSAQVRATLEAELPDVPAEGRQIRVDAAWAEMSGNRNCLLTLLPTLVRLGSEPLTLALTPRRQTLTQLISGTMVIRDAGPGPQHRNAQAGE